MHPKAVYDYFFGEATNVTGGSNPQGRNVVGDVYNIVHGSVYGRPPSYHQTDPHGRRAPDPDTDNDRGARRPTGRGRDDLDPIVTLVDRGRKPSPYAHGKVRSARTDVKQPIPAHQGHGNVLRPPSGIRRSKSHEPMKSPISEEYIKNWASRDYPPPSPTMTLDSESSITFSRATEPRVSVPRFSDFTERNHQLPSFTVTSSTESSITSSTLSQTNTTEVPHFSCRYVAFQLDTSEILKSFGGFDIDEELSQVANKTFVGYISVDSEKSLCAGIFRVRLLQHGIRYKEDGTAERRCIAITPLDRNVPIRDPTSKRTPITPTPPLPWPNCYHYSLDFLRVRIPGDGPVKETGYRISLHDIQRHNALCVNDIKNLDEETVKSSTHPADPLRPTLYELRETALLTIGISYVLPSTVTKISSPQAIFKLQKALYNKLKASGVDLNDMHDKNLV